jgi:hypothetical protein
MSYDLNVYTLRARLPGRGRLSDALAGEDPPIRLSLDTELIDHSGWLPLLIAGRSSGFEMTGSEVTSERILDFEADLNDGTPVGPDDLRWLEMLRTCDVSLLLSCRASNPDELMAASAVARAVARLSGGWYSDPQTGELERFG